MEWRGLSEGDTFWPKNFHADGILHKYLWSLFDWLIVVVVVVLDQFCNVAQLQKISVPTLSKVIANSEVMGSVSKAKKSKGKYKAKLEFPEGGRKGEGAQTKKTFQEYSMDFLKERHNYKLVNWVQKKDITAY